MPSTADAAPTNAPPSTCPATEEVLEGGGVTRVSRVGDTVRRPVRSWTPAVHELLHHLREDGFDGAPRALGLDEHGREILDYVPGEVGNYPLSAQVRSESALVSAGRLLRRFHDATTSALPRGLEGWQLGSLDPVEVLCHGDFAPYNCVFRDGEAVAIIDFDTVRPGPRSWDLAYALYRFAPLTRPENGDGFGSTSDQASRARQLLDAYGATAEQRAATVAMLVPRLQSLVDFMQAAADAGDAGFARHIADGHADLYLHDIAYIDAHADVWHRVVVD
ncbi:phosphotransferase enzyme family protein [Sanguibacter antarcticus]|uniref:phosphotransferase enzyme family protein n=1 Tax=Sanguibacter antarcticus TaxID=372484 RepID=UPI000BF7A5F0|nr:aminoglycoside phosphotransferase family protein [Sanguibacter antarcticus]